MPRDASRRHSDVAIESSNLEASGADLYGAAEFSIVPCLRSHIAILVGVSGS